MLLVGEEHKLRKCPFDAGDNHLTGHLRGGCRAAGAALA